MLATEIRALRSERGLSQLAFGQAVGVTDGMIGLVETGRRLLSVDSIEAVVAGLGLTGAERQRLLAARAADRADQKRHTPLSQRVDELETQLEELRASVDQISSRLLAMRSEK